VAKSSIPTNPAIDNEEWWKGRERVIDSESIETLNEISKIVGRGGGVISEAEERVAWKVVNNFKDDLRVHRVAYARAQAERLPRLTAMANHCLDKMVDWDVVKALPPDLLLKLMDSLAKQMRDADAVIADVAQGPQAITKRSRAKVRIETTTREENAKRAVLQDFLREVDKMLAEEAAKVMENGVPASQALIELAPPDPDQDDDEPS
jgi:hypothetical protein